MKYFDNTPIGTLVTRAVSDIETIADIFSQGLLVIIAELLKLIIVVAMMFYTDWRLAIIAMLTIPVLLVATAWFKRNIKASFQDVREQVSQLNTFVQEHIVGMNIVQIFNRENAVFKIFDKCMSMEQYCRLIDPQIRPRVAAVGELRSLDSYIDDENRFLDTLYRFPENEDDDDEEAMEPDDLYN